MKNNKKPKKRRVSILLAILMAITMISSNAMYLPITAFAEEEVSMQADADGTTESGGADVATSSNAQESTDVTSSEDESKGDEQHAVESSSEPASTESDEQEVEVQESENSDPNAESNEQLIQEFLKAVDAVLELGDITTDNYEDYLTRYNEAEKIYDDVKSAELDKDERVEESLAKLKEIGDALQNFEINEQSEVESDAQSDDTEETGNSEKADESEEIGDSEDDGETEEVEDEIPEEVSAFLEAVAAMEIPKELTEAFMEQYDAVRKAFVEMENAVENYTDYSGVSDAIDKMHEAEDLISKSEEKIPEEVTAFLKAVDVMEIPEELTEENAEAFMDQYDAVYEAFVEMESTVENYTDYSGVSDAIDKMHEAENLISKFMEGIALLSAEVVDVDSFEKFKEVIATANAADSGTFTAKITADIEMTSGLSLTKNTVQIIGNNHTINMPGEFFISTSSKLILGSEDGTDTLTITGKGQFYISGGTMEMHDGVLLTGLTHSGSDGGAVYVSRNSYFNMYGGTISNCSANRGGGVYVVGGTFTMSGNASITNNTTAISGRGAGVHLCNSSTGSKGTFEMSGNASITGHKKGEGVYVTGGTFTMSGNASITGNTGSTASSGGVYLTGGTFTMSGNASISDNSGYTGGGVCMSGGTFNMRNNASITDNRTYDNGGGGVYMSGGTLTMSDDSYITNNTAKSYGNGVRVISGTLKMSGNASITKNNGTGVYVNKAGKVEMSGNASISGHNGDTSSSGGVYVNGGTFAMSENASITGNSGYTGGGVYVTNKGMLEMSGGSITTNTATSDGGGVYISDSTFTMSDGTIEGCTTTSGKGGGVYVAYGTFTMSGTAKIKDCKAIGISKEERGYGGGVSVINSTFNMNGGITTGNTSLKGGGVYISDSTFKMSGGSITANIANGLEDSTGGGVFISDGTFEMSGGSITQNNADYVAGGVYVEDDSTFEMSDGFITQNNAGYAGGGVCVYICTFEMSGGSIAQNNAGYAGGGVAVGKEGSFNMSGTASITKNTAEQWGGGVAIDTGTSLLTNVYDNTAKGFGDDYAGASSSVTLNSIISNQRLNSCPEGCEFVITGWYLDEVGARWGTYTDGGETILHSDNENAYYVEYDSETMANRGIIGLKAAHGKPNSEDEIYNIDIQYDALEFSYEATAIKWDPETLSYKVEVKPIGSTQKNITVTNKSSQDVEMLSSLTNQRSKEDGITYTMSLKGNDESILATITESAFKEATGSKILTCNQENSNNVELLTLELEKIGFALDVETFSDTVAKLSLVFKSVEENN